MGTPLNSNLAPGLASALPVSRASVNCRTEDLRLLTFCLVLFVGSVIDDPDSAWCGTLPPSFKYAYAVKPKREKEQPKLLLVNGGKGLAVVWVTISSIRPLSSLSGVFYNVKR